MKNIFLLVLTLTLSTLVNAQPPVAKEKFYLFLLAGQSNMAGRGMVDSAGQQLNPRILMLDKNGEWQPARDPLHFDKPAAAGVGPGLAFARQMAAGDTTIYIGLVPCAVGGSSIEVWQPGKYYEPTKSFPFDDAIRRTKTAMQYGTLKGILWHQGESDADSLHAPLYQNNLVLLVKRLRKDLKTKLLPFAAGTLAEYYVANHPYAAVINDAVNHLPEMVKKAVVVSASGLTDKGDRVHFDSPSARILGTRYATALKLFWNMQ